MLKKILMVLLLSVLFLSSTADAEDSNRWEWVLSNKLDSIYIDTQSIEYDKDNNYVEYWTKFVEENGDELLVQYALDLKHKGYAVLYSARKSNGVIKDYRLYRDPDPYFHIISISTTPLETTEKHVNAVMSHLGLPPIWGNTPHKWKWVKSTDKESLYICTDAYQLLPDNKMLFFVKSVLVSSYGTLTRAKTYIADFSGKRIYYVEGARPFNVLIPDSLEEAIYNAAIEL